MKCASCKEEARPGKTRCPACAEKARAASKRYYDSFSPKELKEKRKIDVAYWRANRDRWNELNRKRNWNFKLAALAAYGGKCICCGESEPMFLTIDHSNNDGHNHRKLLGCRAGVHFYKKLKKLGFPKNLGLEVACANCHIAKDKYGVCPHERRHI